MGILARALPLFAVGLPVVLAGDEWAFRPVQAAGSAVLAPGGLGTVGARAATFGMAEPGEEFRLRAWALDPAAAAEDLRAELAAGSWTRRAAALDALERAAAVGDAIAHEPWVRAAGLEAVRDGHPNLRAAGLALLARLPGPDGLAADEVRALAADLWSEARERLADLLASREDPGDLEALLLLSEDADRAVAARARGSLALRFEADPSAATSAALAEALRRAGDVGDDDALLDIVRVLARVGVPREALEALFEVLSDAAPEARALIATLVHAAGGDAGREVLLEEWLTAAPWSSDRQALFLAAAEGHADLAQPLYFTAALLANHGRDGLPAPGSRWTPLLTRWSLLHAADAAPPPALAIQHLLRAARAAEGANPFARRVTNATRIATRRATAALAELMREPFEWEQEVADRFARRIRYAVDSGLEDPLPAVDLLEAGARHGDPVAAATLLSLADVEGPVGARAWHALARLPDPTPWLDALGEHMALLEGDAWLDALHALQPRYPVPSLRARLLAEVADEEGAQERAVALLGAFEGDLEVADRLERHLIEALHALGESTPQGANALRMAGELVDALARIAPERSVVVLADALEVSVGRSPALGRAAARALGLSAPGREYLAGLLTTSLDRTTRLEVAAELARAGDAQRAFDVFAEGIHAAPPELAARLFDAFALRTESRLDPFLLALAADPAAERELRHGALSALTRRPGDEGSAELARLVRELADVELVLAALRALAARGGGDAPQQLLSLAEELEGAPSGDGNWPPRARDLREVFAGNWLEAASLAVAARVRAGRELDGAWARLVERVEQAWWRTPDAEAESMWQDRLERVPRAHSQHRFWAEIEALGALASAGRLGAAVDGAPLERLDGRLLLLLADITHRAAQRARAGATPGSAAAAVLARAAAIALLGEGPTGERWRMRARMLLLELESDGDAADRLAAQLRREWRAGDLSDQLLVEFPGAAARLR
jgi:hypothetical protein